MEPHLKLPGDIPGAAGVEEFSDAEVNNLSTVKEYMRIAYGSSSSSEAVRHLMTPDATFEAHDTFPDVHDPATYADVVAGLLKELPDLKIESIDDEICKASRVAVRYTISGTHAGAPHSGIPATGKHARWTAALFFHLNADGRITRVVKFFDKISMWTQLGWVAPVELR